MRIGPLHITWMTSRRARLVAFEVRDELRTNDVRNSIARLARGEVKDYLAELAEGAGMPFPSAAGFLRALRTDVANLRLEPDTPRCDARPYPLGHDGNHRDWVDELDGGAGFAPGDDEAVASNLLFEPDHYSPGDEGVRAHRWCDENPSS